MTSRRDLGPPLAIAGGVAIVSAVIAGFVAVGGPGDARASRLDALQLDRIYELALSARCAFVISGKAPASIADIRTTIAQRPDLTDDDVCGRFDADWTVTGYDIKYTRLDDNRISLCGDFLRPYDPEKPPRDRFAFQGRTAFPELQEARPRPGPHCYEVEFKRPNPDPLATPN